MTGSSGPFTEAGSAAAAAWEPEDRAFTAMHGDGVRDWIELLDRTR